jgi:hypothetical protein
VFTISHSNPHYLLPSTLVHQRDSLQSSKGHSTERNGKTGDTLLDTTGGGSDDGRRDRLGWRRLGGLVGDGAGRRGVAFRSLARRRVAVVIDAGAIGSLAWRRGRVGGLDGEDLL